MLSVLLPVIFAAVTEVSGCAFGFNHDKKVRAELPETYSVIDSVVLIAFAVVSFAVCGRVNDIFAHRLAGSGGKKIARACGYGRHAYYHVTVPGSGRISVVVDIISAYAERIERSNLSVVINFDVYCRLKLAHGYGKVVVARRRIIYFADLIFGYIELFAVFSAFVNVTGFKSVTRLDKRRRGLGCGNGDIEFRDIGYDFDTRFRGFGLNGNSQLFRKVLVRNGNLCRTFLNARDNAVRRNGCDFGMIGNVRVNRGYLIVVFNDDFFGNVDEHRCRSFR